MEIQVEPSSGNGRIQMGESLCIFDVAGLHESFLAAREGVERWEWDLSGVAECDSAGLQWLLMIKDWARKANWECLFESPSRALMELVELYRVHGAMGLVAVMPADEAVSGRR